MSAESATAGVEPGACSVLLSLVDRIPLQRRAEAQPEARGEPDVGTVAGLLRHLLAVPDHRRVVWVDHPLAAVLALCAAAVVAGMRSFTAIAGWVVDVPAEQLACAYAGSGAPVPARGPSKSTIWRVLIGVDGVALDAAIGGWLVDLAYAESTVGDPSDPDQGVNAPGEGRAADPGPPGDPPASCGSGPMQGVAIAADGTTCRGSTDRDGQQVHLLSAMTHQRGLVLAQTDVGVKTNEVPRLKDLLTGLSGRVDLRGAILTVDALHTVRETARWLHEHGLEFVMTVKQNIPTLFAALDALPWDDVPIGYSSTERGHGRITRRTIQTLPAPADLPFPHLGQAFLIERSVTDLSGTNLSNIAALGVSSLTPDRADPARLAACLDGARGLSEERTVSALSI